MSATAMKTVTITVFCLMYTLNEYLDFDARMN